MTAMSSIPDSVESGRSNVGRYASIHTRLQRWNKGRLNGDFQPHIQAHVTRGTNLKIHARRTPALDLAQQAQVAACNYLGYSPREFSNSLYRQQVLSSDSSRPLELHMHHHHHHYVASPTSQFSQSSSQYFEGPVSDITVPTNELTLRVGSPLPASTTSNSTATTYPALGLHGSSAGTPHLHCLHPQGFIQNSSQPLLQAKQLEDVETTPRYLQNVLWLKNQIDDNLDQKPKYAQEQRVEDKLVIEKGMMGRDLGSPMSGTSEPVTSEQRPVSSTHKYSWSREHECSKSDASEGDVCSKRTKPRKSGESHMILEKFEMVKRFSNYHSPYNSPSKDNSITENSTSALSVAPTNSEKSPRNAMSINRAKLIPDEGTKGTGDTHFMQMSKSQVVVKPLGSSICPSKVQSDDTASSLEDDSVCSSGRVSERKSVWTSSCAESDSFKKELSPRLRPAKKTCGARASRRQASREARAWEERKPPKGFYYDNGRPDGRKEHVYVYEMDSEVKTTEKVAEERHTYVPEEKPSCQERSKERGDAGRTRVQARPESELRVPKKITVTEHSEIAWTKSLGTKRGLHQVLAVQDKNGTEKLNSESLHDEASHTSVCSPWVNEHNPRENVSHNRLREAVEAAWKTSLGIKRGLEDPELKQESPDHLCGKLHKDFKVLKGHVSKEECFPGVLKGQDSEEKFSSYEEEAWKASLVTKKWVEENGGKKDPLNHVFGDIHRDHENLKALVAKEESLQRELKDQTVARVAAEERARLAAEQKAQIYEASAKAAEEGLRLLLDERALFHDKFKEELEQGATDRLRLQELLRLEKLKLEATEGELREVRRSFQDSLAVGVRANKNSFQDPRLDMLSVAPQGICAPHDEVQLKLMAESESRIAAEAKASYFEASAKAAEGRLRSLLDERNWFYSRFKEELEQNTTDMIKLQQLMDLEKANQGHSDPPQKAKVDARSLVSLTVAFENPDNENEDGQGTLENAVHDRGSFQPRLKDKLQEEEKDKHSLEKLLELEESELQDRMQYMKEGKAKTGLRKASNSETTDLETGEGFEDNCMLSSSVSVYEDRNGRHERVTHEKLSVKNDKKRPLSPINSSRVRSWKPELPLSVTIEEGSERTTVFDISPGNRRFKSLDLEFEQTSQSLEDYQLAAEDPVEVDIDISEVRKTSNLLPNTCLKSPEGHGGQSLSLPAKWKKETKAEIRRMIQEQELTWKIAEDAVEELGRRLELLERYKMDIQDTLGRSRAMGNMDCFLTRLEEKLEEFPRGFNSLYNSPIFEDRKGAYYATQTSIRSPSRSRGSKDYEIQLLKAEITQLRDEIKSYESERTTPKMKRETQFISSGLKTERDPQLVNHGFEEHLMPQEVVVREMEPEFPDDPFEDMKAITRQAAQYGRSKRKVERLEHCDEISPIRSEAFVVNSSHPFEETKTVMEHATQSGMREYSKRKVESRESRDEFSSKRREPTVDNRSWVPVPDEENRDKIAASNGANDTLSENQKLDYPNGNSKEASYTNLESQKMNYANENDQDVNYENLKSQRVDYLDARHQDGVSENLSPDEGQLQVLKSAVRKLSNIFWEQEGKLKNFKGTTAQKVHDDTSESLDLRNFYVDLLKEMSQQLGELCRDLQANTQTREKWHRMEVMDKPPVPASRPDILRAASGVPQLVNIKEVGNSNLFPTEKVDPGPGQLLKIAEDHAVNLTLQLENLQTALNDAERKLEEHVKTNLLLTEKVESGAKYLSKVMEDHAAEIARKDQSLSYAQQLNIHLANDMSQTESSLAELRSRYKGLVENLECQLKEARCEVTILQETVNELKIEFTTKETLLSNLEGARKDQELTIQEMRSQIQAFRGEADAAALEKIELMKSVQAIRKEADEQQHRVTELVSINEDLIAFSQSKEDEIRELTNMVNTLEQSMKEQSDETTKASEEALKFSQEVAEAKKEGEVHRLRWNFLKTKLEETERELIEREDAMERLTRHLGTTIEGQDSILEEKEHLLLSLNKAQYKEHRLDDQVRQSKIVIQDLEDKLNSMDAEITKARLEMAEIKAKGQDALAIERQAGEMRNRVHQLEEEIMEKEGQISILKTSFPGEYDSTF